MLKTLVKVSEINNLSDARYCAGMGVDMVGFSMDENHPKFIEMAKLREISGWITGIKTVGEFTGDNIENINYLAKELDLNYVQLEHLVSSDSLKKIRVPVILKLNFSDDIENIQKNLGLFQPAVAYFLLESNELRGIEKNKDILKSLCAQYPIILDFDLHKGNLDIILDEINPAGIGLRGGNEIRPGLKNSDELSDILERLEV